MQYCLTLSLKNDPALIRQYENYHKPENVWPEIIASIRDSGIEEMQIYRSGTTLIMVVDVDERFSFKAKAESDRSNPKVQEWEFLMAKFQDVAEGDVLESKWKPISNIFRLTDHISA